MGFKFTVKAQDLNAAIDVTALVEPDAINKQDHAGYLFVIRGNTGYVYSRNKQHVARASFPVMDVEGEGAFIYPKASVGSFKSLGLSDITFSVADGDTYSVSYTTSSKASAEKPSYDPKFGQTCDKELSDAKESCTFSSKLLLEALRLSRDFYVEASDKRSDDKVKSVVIFDREAEGYEKADGYFQASNGMQLFSFYSDAFQGKSLSVHSQHIPTLISFLSKCEGPVKINVGQNMTFATDTSDRVFGWVHHSMTPPKHKNMPFSADHLVMDVEKNLILNALTFLKSEIEANREKIKFVFSPNGNVVTFQITEGSNKATSWPVGVKIKEDETTEKREIQLNVSLEKFRQMFEKAQSNIVQLRISIIPPSETRNRETAMFRTFEEYLLDSSGKVVGGSNAETRPEGSSLCRVMRYTSSMS